MKILAVDVGTTSLKMGIYSLTHRSLEMVRQFSKTYDINIYNGGLFGDIEPEKWQQAFIAGCRSFEDLNADVEVIALSGTTPGLTAMDRDGRALYPAILMLDQHSPTASAAYYRYRRFEDVAGSDRQYAGSRRLFSCQHFVAKG